jgi:hypothetical protein
VLTEMGVSLKSEIFKGSKNGSVLQNTVKYIKKKVLHLRKTTIRLFPIKGIP